jgi:hypothetical protein
MRSLLRASVLILAGSVGAANVAAQTPVTLTVSGNEAQGTITLPGGIGAALTITFENAVGLTPTALQASVTLVSPLDLGLLARLPSGFPPPVGIPGAFPVLLEIEPAPGSALSFSGIVKVSLYTFNLNLNALVPLSFFKASNGGSFKDITTSEASGSYRVDGSGGDLSEFLIVVDLRSINSVINQKFTALQATLTANSASMPPAVASSLQTQLDAAKALFQSGATVQAITAITAFSQYVKDHSGADIPDVWQAGNPSLVNAAGRLRSGADTLRFSLVRKTNG